MFDEIRKQVLKIGAAFPNFIIKLVQIPPTYLCLGKSQERCRLTVFLFRGFRIFLVTKLCYFTPV